MAKLNPIAIKYFAIVLAKVKYISYTMGTSALPALAGGL